MQMVNKIMKYFKERHGIDNIVKIRVRVRIGLLRIVIEG